MSEKVKRKAAEFSPIRKWWATIFGITAISVISVGYFVTDKFVVMPLYLLHISADDGFWYFVIALVASAMLIVSLFDFPVLSRNRYLTHLRFIFVFVFIALTLVISPFAQPTDQPWIRYYQTVPVNNRQWVIFSELNMAERLSIFAYECDGWQLFCSHRLEYYVVDEYLFDLIFNQEENSYFVYDVEQAAFLFYSFDRLLGIYPIDAPK